jgi:hypothetical protein
MGPRIEPCIVPTSFSRIVEFLPFASSRKISVLTGFQEAELHHLGCPLSLVFLQADPSSQDQKQR